MTLNKIAFFLSSSEKAYCSITKRYLDKSKINNYKIFYANNENHSSVLEDIKKEGFKVFVTNKTNFIPTLDSKASIDKYRGSLIEIENYRFIPIVSFSELETKEFWMKNILFSDLKRALKFSDPNEKLLSRNLITSPSFDQVMTYLGSIESGYVGFDIETYNNGISHISFATSPEYSMCITFFDGGKHYFTRSQEADIWQQISIILQHPNVIKIAQNAIFDFTYIYRKFGIISHPIEDTMIAMSIAYPEMPKGLDFITSISCNGEPYYKDDKKEWKRITDIENFRRYSARDSAVTIESFFALKESLKEQENYSAYKRQIEIIPPLVFMGERGIKVDKKSLSDYSEKIGKNIEELNNEIQAKVGYPINIKSSQQLQKYFYGVLNITPYMKNKRPTLDEKALTRIYTNKKLSKGREEADLILKHRTASKLKSTYLDMTIDKDDRIRSQFNPIAWTGRLTSSKSSNSNIEGKKVGGNLQNLHPEFKKFLISDPDYFITCIDLSQAENRVVAYISNETGMIKAFESGKDLHKITASGIYGVNYEEVSEDQRFRGKVANHSINYGIKPRRFALENKLDLKEATFIIDQYLHTYPAIARWQKTQINKVVTDKYVENLFGRRCYFLGSPLGPRGYQMHNKILSFSPQSTVAEKTNQHGIKLIYYNNKFKKSILLNQIHDSIEFAWPIKDLEEYIKVLKILVDKLSFPIEVIKYENKFIIPCDVKIGITYGNMREFKYKEIKSKLASQSFSSEISELLSAQAR